jgi:predicted RNA-binding Zn-ribbon protein involved in translation (DUF1610 family)
MQFLQAKYLAPLFLIVLATVCTIVFASTPQDSKDEVKSIEQTTLQHSKMQCPKCGGEMEEGFIFEDQYGHAKVTRQWAKEGAEADSWGYGVKGARKITTDRCTKCGFLGDSYAK